MSPSFAHRISTALSLQVQQVENTLALLDAGCTIPFIARYRKERTGNLDEVRIAEIRDMQKELSELEKRREFILRSIAEQGKLDGDLEKKIMATATLVTLEDLYLPFKPKKKTRAGTAREKGLEPLAKLLFTQGNQDPDVLAEKYVSEEKGVSSPEEALQGARDIIAEWVSEDSGARESLRVLFHRKAVVSSRVVKSKAAEATKYSDYFEFSEPLSRIPSHRYLALSRGENEGFLRVSALPPEEEAIMLLERRFVKGRNLTALQVGLAVNDSYKRLLAPSLETEFRTLARNRADAEAIRVFAENVRQLLFESPLGRRNILAIDPGFRTGCKLVCLNEQGDLVHNETVYPHSGGRENQDAAARILNRIQAYRVEAIAIGNGTAGRETEAFIKKLRLPANIPVIMVNESGASVYSASPVAREEFPEFDVTVRGAVSIGRRLMDPLAELVKIDPRSIGVGQYQHDVDQGKLQESLADVVSSAVNAVGVEVNTASKQLLTYVSGLGPVLAQNIVDYRKKNGPFSSRRDLMKVPRMGEKAFEQCAGFLRISGAAHPLDSSAVHPESYGVVESMARDLRCSVEGLLADASLRKQIRLDKYVSDQLGLPSLNDILKELEKPGRDPRGSFEQFSFQSNIHEMKDLQTGMILPGIVTNITAFGCFVDIGVHQDGLVHISELAPRFVKDPNEVVKLRQKVTVKVLEVDTARKRIQLSIKQAL